VCFFDKVTFSIKILSEKMRLPRYQFLPGGGKVFVRETGTPFVLPLRIFGLDAHTHTHPPTLYSNIMLPPQSSA